MPPHVASLPRLYAILDIDLTRDRGLDPDHVFEAWLAAGVRLIQLRAKTLSTGAFLEVADRLCGRARDAGATFVVNDRADIARLARADGVHVGQDDLSPIDVRRVVGDAALVGLSTHTAAQADAARFAPVSYVAIGPVFATPTKRGGIDAPVGLDGVREAAGLAVRPLVAIGGITLARAREVIAAGADSVAVIADLLTEDVERRAREYVDVLQ